MAGVLSADELKLYTLIWQRFVASQMTPAQFDVTDVVINAGRYGFKAKGEVEVEAGFLRVYREESDETAAADRPGEGSAATSDPGASSETASLRADGADPSGVGGA